MKNFFTNLFDITIKKLASSLNFSSTHTKNMLLTYPYGLIPHKSEMKIFRLNGKPELVAELCFFNSRICSFNYISKEVILTKS